jgi:hypothetical protein
MAGVAMYASAMDDPYITNAVDGDSSDEGEDFNITANDNLLVAGKVMKVNWFSATFQYLCTLQDEFTLEVYIYNAMSGDFYVHHDYTLQTPPTCVARMG